MDDCKLVTVVSATEKGRVLVRYWKDTKDGFHCGPRRFEEMSWGMSVPQARRLMRLLGEVVGEIVRRYEGEIAEGRGEDDKILSEMKGE